MFVFYSGDHGKHIANLFVLHLRPFYNWIFAFQNILLPVLLFFGAYDGEAHYCLLLAWFSPYAWTNFWIRFDIDVVKTPPLRRRLFRFGPLRVNKCLAPALNRFNLPEPLTLKRFAAFLLVFILGILFSFYLILDSLSESFFYLLFQDPYRFWQHLQGFPKLLLIAEFLHPFLPFLFPWTLQ